MHHAKQAINVEGVILTINAVEICRGEWELSIENQLGVRTVWTDFFDSSNEALDAGRRAVNEEGAGAFLEVDEFGYLLDKRPKP